LDRGRYGLQLPIGYHYRFVFENKFYKTDSLDFNLAKTVINPQYEKDVELTPVIQKVILHVVDIKSGKGVPTVVQIVTEGGHKFTTQVKTDKNGNVVLNLRKGEVYDIAVMPKGYTFFNEKLDLRKPAQKPVKEIVARLKPLEANTKIEFHNITFETNSAELNADSYQELDRLVELLKKNPNIKVEISAHTDNVGSEAYNMKLSLRRAQSVVNYLLEHGVPRSQMIAKGYGETRPLVPNDTPEHRAMNRRVELKILKVNNQ
jgi:outer membrane protein OmpA-like peptidoglycan-associated protein